MLTRGDIIRTERIINEFQERVHETADNRDRDAASWAAWEDVTRQWHEIDLPTDFLWSDETRDKIRAGDGETIEDAILFLEVDPWHFRSGYLKEYLLLWLKNAPLNEIDKERLRQVVLDVARGRNRREFRDYCSLAAKIASDEFVNKVAEESKAHDKESCGKFSYLLRFLQENRKKANQD